MSDQKKKILKKVTFDFEGAEVSYTTPAKGGAASLKNKAYLFKSLEPMDKQTESQVAENVAGGNTKDASGNVGGISKEDSPVSKTENENQKVLDLEKRVAELELEKALGAHALSDETKAALGAVAVNTTVVQAIKKALDEVSSGKDTELQEVKKQLGEATKTEKPVENALQKSLSEEVGKESATAEKPVQKSLVQRAIEIDEEESK